MDTPQMLGERGRVSVAQEEQGTVILQSTDLPIPLALSSDEALELLQWLFERRDGLILQTPTGKLEALEPR